MFETAITGCLSKPFWLSETEKCWPLWKLARPERKQARADGV
jgi:5-methyltetrahydropteroyltriglutamate--homocysteine methyltransferase